MCRSSANFLKSYLLCVSFHYSTRVDKKFEKMEGVISKAKSFPVDCNNVDKKLRQILDLTEDEASFHMKQSVFLYQLAVQTMPKSLHCLSMRLTVEHFKSGSVDIEDSEKFSDPSLLHFVIISDNILASSVVINSTAVHARVCVKSSFCSCSCNHRTLMLCLILG